MSTLEKVLRAVVIAGIFVLPFVCLFISVSLFFPYITGKNFAIRAIVEIMTAAWLALALVKPSYRPARSWLLVAFTAFTLIIAAADAFGVSPFKSFWSNFERMDGWITLAHMFIYFVVATSVMHTEKIWTRLLQVSLGVSAYLSVYGVMQVLGLIGLGQGGGVGLERRVDATFGNPIYLAVYMLFHVAFAVLLFNREYHNRSSRSGVRITLMSIYGVVAVFDAIALFLTGTRGTILGLIGGAIIAAITLAFQKRESARIRYISVGVVTVVIALSGLFWAIRDSAIVHNVSFLERMTTISLNDNSTKARIMNWHIALQGFKERPILGWGQENYAIVFDKYYDPHMYGQEPWFDRVHNIIFDWLVAGGVLGLLAYLSVIGSALVMVWRKNVFNPVERSVLTGLIVGYFIHNFFVFDNVISYLLFATVAAYIAWRSFAAEKTETVYEKIRLNTKALPYTAGAAVVVAIIAVWSINYPAYAQNTMLIKTLSSTNVNADDLLAGFQKTAAIGAFGTQEVREQLAQVAAQLAGNASVNEVQKKAWLAAATDAMHTQGLRSPLDARFPFFEGIVYSSYGAYDEATTALKHALALAPSKQLIMYEIARIDEARGDTDAALQEYADTLNVAPENDTARARYAATAITAHKDALADELLAPIIARGDALDPSVAKAYAQRKQFGKIATIGEAHLAVHPEDLQGYLTLAAAYYSGGDTDQTIAVLERAAQAVPASKADLDALIGQVRAGTVK